MDATHAGLGAHRLAVWTPAEAQDAGLSRHQVAGRIGREWQQIYVGALTDAGHVPDTRQRAAAALAVADDEAVVGGRTAARWWGLPLIEDGPAPERFLDDVLTFRRLGGRPRLIAHRWAYDDTDVISVDGIRLTTPLRTLLDLSRLVGLDALLGACDAAVRLRLTSAPQITAAAARLHARPGGPALRWCARWVDGRAQSPLETLTRITLWHPQLPAFEPQLLVHDADGEVLAALDHGVRALQLGVESDGAGPHSLPEARFVDRHREATVADRGYRLLRVTWPDVRRARADVRRRVGRAAAEQAARLRVTAPPPSPLPAPPAHIWR